MGKWTAIAIGILVAALGAGAFVATSDSDDDTASNTTQASQSNQSSDSSATSAGPSGQLVSYSPESLANSETENNLIFFHASWCTICESVKRNIEAGSIPAGLTIHQVNYDSDEGQDLADQYNLRIQYTMVAVDNDGNELGQWINQFSDGVDEITANLEQI